MSAVANETLFKGAQQALVFAFRFSSQQYQKSAQFSGGARPEGKGLGGLDGAAQAGMIYDLVKSRVSESHFAVLTARCAPHSHPCTCGAQCCRGYKPNDEWYEAIGFLVTASASEFSGAIQKRRLIDIMIRRFFGNRSADGKSDSELAKAHDVNRNVIPAYRARIKLWMYGEDPKRVEVPRKGLEVRAWEEADAILQQAGII